VSENPHGRQVPQVPQVPQSQPSPTAPPFPQGWPAPGAPAGYVQTSPGAPPMPMAPAAGLSPAGSAIPPTQRARTLGVIALSLALAAGVVSCVLSALTGFAAAEGAMRHAIGVSPSGLEDLTSDELLALLSPVRGLVLWAEIGYWVGTVLGIVGLALGIAATATRRGRGQGIAAIAVAGAGPFVYAAIVGTAVIAGIAAGAA
jgi:hypothetical protein